MVCLFLFVCSLKPNLCSFLFLSWTIIIIIKFELTPLSFRSSISVLYRLVLHIFRRLSVRGAIYSCCLYFLFLTSLYEVPTSSRDEDGLPPKESRLATLCPHEAACPSLSVRLISKVGTVLGS